MRYIPRSARRARPEFSIAVVNIVFLLLLFYLATGSLISPRELSADAPATSALELELLPRPLLLAAADGSFLLDGTPVAPEDLPHAARAAAGAGVLNVLADRHMPGRAFLSLLARLEAGGVPLRIVTLHVPEEAVGAAQ